jgi:hypothetical protein
VARFLNFKETTMTTEQSKLLQRIAALPNTTLEPYRFGGGVHIVEKVDNGVRFSGVWLDRSNTVGHLRDYLQRRSTSQ